MRRKDVGRDSRALPHGMNAFFIIPAGMSHRFETLMGHPPLERGREVSEIARDLGRPVR